MLVEFCPKLTVGNNLQALVMSPDAWHRRRAAGPAPTSLSWSSRRFHSSAATGISRVRIKVCFLVSCCSLTPHVPARRQHLHLVEHGKAPWGSELIPVMLSMHPRHAIMRERHMLANHRPPAIESEKLTHENDQECAPGLIPVKKEKKSANSSLVARSASSRPYLHIWISNENTNKANKRTKQ